MRQPIFLEKLTECPYEKPFGYIYLITNKENFHRYIGKHVYDKPYIDDKYWASGGKHLQNAVNNSKNGKNDFLYEILAWVDGKDNSPEILGKYLADLEIYYIDLLGTYINSEDYNETPGGDNYLTGSLNPMYKNHRFSGKNHPMYRVRGSDNPRTGTHHSESAKEKMRGTRPSISGENNPMYGVRLMGEKNPFYGKHHTEETKKKISEANKRNGRSLSGENNPMYGKHHTKEAREKMSLARLGIKNHNYGKPMTEYAKEKNRQAHLGKKMSEATKTKLKSMWTKPINQYDTNGNLIREFPYGALSIGRNLKISGKQIWDSCIKNDNSIVEGYIWKFRS